MLQLRCLPVGDETLAMDEQEFVLELPDDPTRLILTLNVCRMLMPSDTASLHVENWRQLEALVRQAAAIYQQVRSPALRRCRRYRRRRPCAKQLRLR